MKRSACTAPGFPRPCPLVDCRHNLHEFNGGDEQAPSCVLDVVDARGALTIAEVAEVIGRTRQRVHQIARTAEEKFKRRSQDWR